MLRKKVSKIIESLKNPIHMSDYVYITQSSGGKQTKKGENTIRTRTLSDQQKMGLSSLPKKGLYILDHPLIPFFYLGITVIDMIQRWRNHTVKITGIGLGIRAKDTNLYSELRKEFISLGLNPVEEYHKIKVYFIPMENYSQEKIDKTESMLVPEGLKLGLFKYNSAKRHPAMNDEETSFLINLMKEKSSILKK